MELVDGTSTQSFIPKREGEKHYDFLVSFIGRNRYGVYQGRKTFRATDEEHARILAMAEYLSPVNVVCLTPKRKNLTNG